MRGDICHACKQFVHACGYGPDCEPTPHDIQFAEDRKVLRAEIERLRADIAEWKEGLEAPNATVAAYERGHTLSGLRQLDSEVNRIKDDGEVRRKQGHNEAVGELVASFKNPEDQRVAEYAAILHERLAKLRGEYEPS